MPNAARQTQIGFKSHNEGAGEQFLLAFAGFDDQGEAFAERNDQVIAIRSELDQLLASNQDAIIVAFVHGWRHNADAIDPDLYHVKGLLAQIANKEAQARTEERPARPVYGIFINWRGLSFYGNALAEVLTFWGRQGAARRISNGSVRELFALLRRYRTARLDADGAPMLVIAGHSFGGLIVYSALEQSLVDAASLGADHVIPSFADLVLLINPAFEASRYLPIYRLSKILASGKSAQAPVFVCACADNDMATGIAFPIGNWFSAIKQSTRTAMQRLCRNRTIGHVDPFRTHTLTAGGGTFKLDLPDSRLPNPFWIVRADKAVIDGHSGIWKPEFLRFLASLLWVKAQTSTGGKDPKKRERAISGVTTLSDVKI
ncbi:hypothetical protein [Agrobacterium rhizogenes]|nr:hypothetical protein [Rhizobium rhizogenes]